MGQIRKACGEWESWNACDKSIECSIFNISTLPLKLGCKFYANQAWNRIKDLQKLMLTLMCTLRRTAGRAGRTAGRAGWTAGRAAMDSRKSCDVQQEKLRWDSRKSCDDQQEKLRLVSRKSWTAGAAQQCTCKLQ